MAPPAREDMDGTIAVPRGKAGPSVGNRMGSASHSTDARRRSSHLCRYTEKHVWRNLSVLLL